MVSLDYSGLDDDALDDDAKPGAEVSVQVRWRGQTLRQALVVSDNADVPVLMAMLEQAVEQMQTELKRLRKDRLAQQLRDKITEQELRIPLLDAPLLLSTESDLPARGGQCRAIVVDPLSLRRRACGLQLDAQGRCQGVDRHVTADKPATCERAVWRKGPGVRGTAVRSTCGYQLAEDGTCPNKGIHIANASDEDPFE